MEIQQNSTALLKHQERELRDAVSYAIEIATYAGASAEVAVTKVSGLSVSARLQEVENVEFNNDGSIGNFCSMSGSKKATSTSDLSLAIKSAVESALAIVANILRRMIAPDWQIVN